MPVIPIFETSVQCDLLSMWCQILVTNLKYKFVLNQTFHLRQYVPTIPFKTPFYQNDDNRKEIFFPFTNFVQSRIGTGDTREHFVFKTWHSSTKVGVTKTGGGVLLPPWARADRAVKCPHTPSLAPIYSRPIPFQWGEFASDMYRVSIVTSTPHKSSNYKKVNESYVKSHYRLTLRLEVLKEGRGV